MLCLYPIPLIVAYIILPVFDDNGMLYIKTYTLDNEIFLEQGLLKLSS